MKSIFLSFLLFSFINLFSQNNKSSSNPDYNTSFTGNTSKNGMWIPGRVEDKSIVGSQYLFNSWNGMYSIVNKIGEKFNLLNLNYNIHTKTLESKVSNDSVFQFDLDKIDYIIASKKKYKILNNEMFLELLCNDKIDFYKSFKVIVQEATNNPLTQTELTPRRYVVKNEYKVFYNKVLVDIGLNKKSIFNLFADKKNLISKYVKENKLSYSNEEDVVKILNYISNN
ncbi:hypothetical protein [Flavobacterium sp.]|uniref:hypothetical protein n=1 Tax=Flavobacterium sp. TaxID=239 RepID=UPI0035B19EE5